jgi:hypothetical protein
MTDSNSVQREAANSRLPELEAVNGELQQLMQSILTPSVIAALSAAPGSPAAVIDSASAQATTERAAQLLRDLDSRLPALRAGTND